MQYKTITRQDASSRDIGTDDNSNNDGFSQNRHSVDNESDRLSFVCSNEISGAQSAERVKHRTRGRGAKGRQERSSHEKRAGTNNYRGRGGRGGRGGRRVRGGDDCNQENYQKGRVDDQGGKSSDEDVQSIDSEGACAVNPGVRSGSKRGAYADRRRGRKGFPTLVEQAVELPERIVPCEESKVRNLEELRYMYARHIHDQLRVNFKVNVTINLKDSTMTVEGHTDFVTRVFHEADTFVEQCHVKSTDVSEDFSRFLRLVLVGDIVSKFKTQRIYAGWCVRDGQLHICSGCKQDSDAAFEIINKMVSDVELVKARYRSIGKQNVSDTEFVLPDRITLYKDVKHVEPDKLRLFSALRTQDKFRLKYKVDVRVSLKDYTVTVEGHNEFVFKVFEEIDLFIQKSFTETIQVSEEFRKSFIVLRASEIVELFKARNVFAGWDLRSGSLYVSGESLHSTKKAMEVIQEMVFVGEYPANRVLHSTELKAITSVSHSSAWTHLRESLKREDDTKSLDIYFDPSLSKIKFAIRSTGNTFQITNRLDEYFKRHSLTKRPMLVEKDMAQLLLQNKEFVLTKCSTEGVDIDLSCLAYSQECKLSAGSEDAIHAASVKIQKLVDARFTELKSYSKVSSVSWCISEAGKSKLKDIDKLSNTVSSIIRKGRSRSPSFTQPVLRKLVSAPVPKLPTPAAPSPPRPSLASPVNLGSNGGGSIIANFLSSLFSKKSKSSTKYTAAPPSTLIHSHVSTGTAALRSPPHPLPDNIFKCVEIRRGDISSVGLEVNLNVLLKT